MVWALGLRIYDRMTKEGSERIWIGDTLVTPNMRTSIKRMYDQGDNR